MVRAQKSTVPTAAPPRPAAEPPALVAEREANELLAKGDSAAAAAKFREAERLSNPDRAQVVEAAIAAVPATDAAVRQSAASQPGTIPDLSAPADNPTAAPAVATPAPAAARLLPRRTAISTRRCSTFRTEADIPFGYMVTRTIAAMDTMP